MPASVTSISPRRQRSGASIAAGGRRPFRDNPRLILAGIVVLVGCARRDPDRRESIAVLAGFHVGVRALRAHRGRPHDAGRARVRARAQHRQADRRAAGRPAVRPVPRQARRAAARHDARAGRARAGRRQRADPHAASSSGSTRRWTKCCRRRTRSPATTTRSGSCSSPTRRRASRGRLRRSI